MTSLLRKRDIFNEWESLLKHSKFNPAHYCRDEAELMEQDSRYPHLNEEVELADFSLSEVSIMVTSNSHYLCFYEQFNEMFCQWVSKDNLRTEIQELIQNINGIL